MAALQTDTALSHSSRGEGRDCTPRVSWRVLRGIPGSVLASSVGRTLSQVSVSMTMTVPFTGLRGPHGKTCAQEHKPCLPSLPQTQKACWLRAPNGMCHLTASRHSSLAQGRGSPCPHVPPEATVGKWAAFSTCPQANQATLLQTVEHMPTLEPRNSITSTSPKRN